MLVSRFLLDLQGANQRAFHLVASDDPLFSESGSAIGMTSLMFARIDAVGSLGAALPAGEFASWCSSAEAEGAEDGLGTQCEVETEREGVEDGELELNSA